MRPCKPLFFLFVSLLFELIIIAGGDNKLPYGNLPRLLLAWVSTEAVRTQNRVLLLGDSVSEFMRKLDIYSTSGRKYGRLREQMKRLFNAHVQLIYEAKHGQATVNALIARHTELWWNPKRPDDRTLWESKIELSEDFFNEIIRHPVPLDMNTLKALKRSSLTRDRRRLDRPGPRARGATGRRAGACGSPPRAR